MKLEVIVAKIEEYVASLPAENREAYDGVMSIKATHPESNIKYFKSVLSDPILNLAVIVDELKQEIKENTIKNNSGNSTLQRIKKLNKFMSTNVDKPKFQKAWIEDDWMCATNGYIGFMFNEPLEGVEIREVDMNDFNLSNCFPKEYDLKETKLDIADVKSQLKLHKAKEAGKKAKDKTTCNYIIDGHYYNAEYLIQAYEILGGNIVFYQSNNVLTAAMMKSENGKAVILPIRPPKDK